MFTGAALHLSRVVCNLLIINYLEPRALYDFKEDYMKLVRKLISTTVALALALASALLVAFAVQVGASGVNTRSVPTIGGNRNVTYIVIPLDDTYTVNALSAMDTFGTLTANLADFIAIAEQQGGTDTIVFPVNFFTTGDGTNEVVGGIFSQGRVVSAEPQPWLDFGVGFTADNRVSFFDGRFTDGHIYGAAWDAPRLEYVTAFNIFPHLVENGQILELAPHAAASQTWMDGRVLRAFMGQRADGSLVVGNVSGTSIRELQDIAVYLGLVIATNIDGGASTSLWRNGNMITSPGRQLASVAFITNNRVAPGAPLPTEQGYDEQADEAQPEPIYEPEPEPELAQQPEPTPTADAYERTAVPSAHTVLVNGTPVAFRAFMIDDNNFFMLRDIAYTISGTESQFEVAWDGGLGAINLISGQAYIPVGGEMQPAAITTATATTSTAVIFVNGAIVSLRAYSIADNNFFMLRDLGDALGFEVDWDPAAGAVIISTTEY